MSNYSYVAVDSGGAETRGTLEVSDQSQALQRIKEMGLFPTKVFAAQQRPTLLLRTRRRRTAPKAKLRLRITLAHGRVRSAMLAIFTRQLATLVEAGMPLLRGLRILQEQEQNRTLKRIAGEVASTIENGSSLTEALSAHPKVFNPLYLNMVKAGELGGGLEVALRRLAEFMEKARKIRGKIKAALFYPVAVLFVAAAILGLLTIFVVPRFRAVFGELLGDARMPSFTMFVFRISSTIGQHIFLLAVASLAPVAALLLSLRTRWGRWSFDQLKLKMPILGIILRKAAISRFARTLGTLIGSGVPILQALTIVKETAGNVIVGQVIGSVHESVKQGDTVAAPLKASRVFPVMVAGMVDVGEQTGALPEMLLKIADNYDDEVDNAVNGMTALLEPLLIVFLAIIVGSIVIAMFLPLVRAADGFSGSGAGPADN